MGPFAKAISSAALGYLLGTVGSWFVWNCIYSMGFRVVSDEIYEELQSDVVLWGSAVGAFIGFTIGAVSRKWRLGSVMGVHALSVFAGLIGGSTGWMQGLVGYFGCQLAAFVVIMALWWKRRAARARSANEFDGDSADVGKAR
jgi:hypothetical protein